MNIQVKVAKLNSVLDFEVEQLPAASVQYLITYGLTQALNDAHASVARKNYGDESAFLADVETKVAKREEQIRSGDVPGTRQPADAKTAVARRLAKELEAAGVDASTVTAEEAAEIAKIFAKRRAKHAA